MCMALYVAAAEPLPIVGWNESKPAFNVQELSDSEQIVRRHFTKPHVYYLGAHTGCSCGFAFGQLESTSAEDEAEETAGRASVAALQKYLRDAVQRTGEVELYSCWEGDQGHVPEQNIDITPESFAGDAFRFPEKAFFRVRSLAV
jgi:hypothetical protein